MIHLIVLPFAIQQPRKVDRANLLLGEPLGLQAADALCVHGVLDAEFSDPLSQGGNRYLYSRHLAAKIIPTLAQHLEVDFVLFGELTIRSEIKLGLVLYAPDNTLVFEWEGEAPPDAIFALLREGVRATLEALEVEPSAHELLRIERLPTRDFEAFRCYALAHALAPSPQPEHLTQRISLLEHAIRLDHEYFDAYEMAAEALLDNDRPEEAVELLDTARHRLPGDPDVLDAFAHIALEADRPALALDAAQQILLDNPFSSSAHHMRARSLMALQRYEEASFALQESVRRLPEEHELRLDLSACLLRLGEPEQSLVWLEPLLELTPEDIRFLVNAGQAYEQLGETERAEAIYRRALELEPDAAFAHNNLGCLLLRTHRPAQAVLALHRSHRLAQNDPRIGTNLVRALLRVGDYPSALQLFELIPPDARNLQLELRMLESALSERDLAVAFQLLEDLDLKDDDALPYRLEIAILDGDLQRAHDLFSDAQESEDDLAEYVDKRLDDLVRAALQRGELSLAERALALTIEARPDDLHALLKATAIQLERGRFNTAEPWLEAALQLDPAHVTTHELLAQLLIATSRRDEARSRIAESLLHPSTREALLARISPTDALLLSHARAAIDAGLEPDARRIMGELMDADSRRSELLSEALAGWLEDAPATDLEAVRLLQAAERHDEARRLLGRILEGEAESADARCLAGVIADRADDPEGARAHWLRALELEPEHVEAHALLGARCLAEAQHLEAIDHLERAARGAPSDRRILEMLQTALGLIIHPGA